jgi:hypothetical protein
MAERTTEREREEEGAFEDVSVADDFGDLTTGGGVETTETTTTDRADSGLTARATDRATDVFAPRPFLLLLGAAAVGVFAVGNLIPLLPFTGFLGLFLVMVAAGLASSTQRYVEAGVAGAITGAIGLFVGSVTLTVLTGGLPLAVGGVVGALASLAGFYAGRDIRDGLTREL